MFKYQLSSQKAEASNEVLLDILMPFLVVGSLLAIGKCIQVISDWRAKKKEGKTSPSDKMRNYISHLSLEELQEDSSEIPNSNKVNDPSGKGAHHAVTFNDFMRATAALKAATKVLELSAGKKGSAKNIKALCSKLHDEIPVYKEENGSLIIEFDDSGAVWPSDVWYKDLDGCNKKFWNELNISIQTVNKLIPTVDKIITLPTDGVSQDELNDRVAFVQACELFAMFVAGTYGGYLSNLDVLADETSVQS